MTREQLDRIVLLIGNGANTYRQIKEAIPELSDKELQSHSVIEKYIIKNLYFYLKDSEGFQQRDHFLPEDIFVLNENGLNLLYRLRKEDRLLALTEKSVDIAEESLRVSKHSDNSASSSALYAKLAFLLGLLSFFYSVLFR